MKNCALLVCLLLVTSCAHVPDKPAETASSTSVDGWWTGDFQETNLFFNLKSDGDILSRYVNGVPGIPVVYLKDGKIEEDRISFWAEINTGQDKLRADYMGDMKEYDIMFHYTTTVTDSQGNSTYRILSV